ncbi:uncharacterized protein LOC131678515 [Topomyia yanbarensis]|uniref:uncharacterized protein LOC131678515 n=1 Tax=Topomyia yanbarensis TaxID=2498891 RepID=UPI00273B1281|nr:uncharacterized protein LOC131678515 [Topomyia yanbarensis]
MSTFIGSVEPYVPGTSFGNYLERLRYVFNYNNIPEASRKSLFITVSGATVFNELKKLYPGVDIDTLVYDDMTARLKERFDKKDGKMVQKALFYERCQRKDESVEDFIIDVKLLAENCGFGTMKDAMARDRLVLGAYDIKVRERLMEEEEPTLEEVERILISRERLARRAMLLEQTNERVSAIERLGVRRDDQFDSEQRNARRDEFLQRQHGSDERERRYQRYDRSRSGSRPRWNSWNKNKAMVCSFCNVRGHIKKNCFKRQRSQQSVRFLDESTEEQEVANFKRMHVSQPSESDDDLECMSIAAVKD